MRRSLSTLLATCLAVAASAQHRVLLRYAEFDPLVTEPHVAVELRARPGTRLALMQVHHQLTDRDREQLARLGVRVHQYLPQGSYVVRGAFDSVRSLDFVRFVGPFHPAFKLDDALRAIAPSKSAIEPVRCNVLLVDKHRDAAVVESAIERLGGTVHVGADGGIVIDASLAPGQLLALAHRDEVLWIDRATPVGEDIDNARIQFGVDSVQRTAGNDGRGMTGHVLEGVFPTHPEFAARPPYRVAPIAVGDGTPTGHGNATAGEIFARGANPMCTGMLPFAQMTYTHYRHVLGNTARYGLTRTLVNSVGPHRVRFQTSSWGYARTTLYTARSAEMDDIIHDLDLFVTQSHGNSGSSTQTQQSRPQAWAKNIVSVGGFLHGNNANPADDRWGRSGSTGPAMDGRIGMTFTGYYDHIFTTDYNATGYRADFGGTSGATPMVCGIGASGIQLFTDGYLGYPPAPSWMQRYRFTPKFSTSKAMLMASSDFLRFAVASRYQQGWGTPNVKTLFDQRQQMLIVDEEDVLQAGQHRTYFVFVKPQTSELRVAMSYADPEAAPNTSGPLRINSLDLSVRSPGDVTYWGNHGLLAANQSAAGGSANDLDTEEMVVVSNPAAGVWSVDVRATAVRMDAHVETRATDADFGLAIRGIGGGRDLSGMKLDLVSARTGDLRLVLTNVPAGYAGGYTLLSFDTGRHLALGNVFGLEADGTTLAILASTPSIGNPLAFLPPTSGTSYPRAPFAMPPAVALALRGRTIDGVALVYDASGRVLAASNADRVVVR